MTESTESTFSTVEAPRKKAFVPAFSVGDETSKRFNGRIIGVCVFVNVSHKNQGREGDACIPLYEVPLMRRLYERDGGTLTIRPNWVPSIPRHRVLTDVLFDDKNTQEAEALGELNRLRRTYLLRNSGQVVDLMAEVYGATKAEQARNLQKGMKEIFDGWKALYESAKARVYAKREDLKGEVMALFDTNEDVTVKVFQATLDAWMLELTGLELTVNELEELVNLVDPRAKGLEDYTLDGIDDSRPQRARLIEDEVMRPAAKKATAPAPVSEPEKALANEFSDTEEEAPDRLEISHRVQKALEAAGYDETTSMEIAMLHMDHANLPDDILSQVPSLKKHPATYKKVRKVVSEGMVTPVPVEA